MSDVQIGFCHGCESNVVVCCDSKTGDVSCSHCNGLFVELTNQVKVVEKFVELESETTENNDQLRLSTFEIVRRESFDSDDNENDNNNNNNNFDLNHINNIVNSQTNDNNNNHYNDNIKNDKNNESNLSDSNSSSMRFNDLVSSAVEVVKCSIDNGTATAEERGRARVITNSVDDLIDAVFVHPLNNLFSPLIANPKAVKSPPTHPDTFEKLPRIILSESHVELMKTECSVCKCDFEMSEETIQLPCEHLFHSDCISQWLNQASTCPVCRLQLLSNDPKYNRRQTNISR